MADVTGPISTLSGTRRVPPIGTMCDEHVNRPAVARIQGETDSFGSEQFDMCKECIDKFRAYRESDEGKADALLASTGECDWCKKHATDLRDRRDLDEGSYGRVYSVCGECCRRDNERAQKEWDEGRDDYFDE